MSAIHKALEKADETKIVEIGTGAIQKSVSVLEDCFPGQKAVIIADKNTYLAVGDRVQKYLSDAHLDFCTPFIIDDPNLYANYKYVQKVKSFLEPLDAIALAVGAGVINDLVKLASHELGRQYMCIATAASMDGYAAFGASITKEGAKQTMNCSAPKAIIADMDVISKVPYINNASGYADLYAKVPAGADWIMADVLGVESIDNHAWHTVQDGLSKALKDPEGVKKGDAEAIELLTEGLLLGGFAMQSLKSSRPASGAEHQFSHTWDMEHHTFEGEKAKQFGLYKDIDRQAPSHGLKVGIGTLTTTALYERVLETDFNRLDVKESVNMWHPLEDQIKEGMSMFDDDGVKEFVAQQITAKYVDKKELEEQLNMLKDNWELIRKKIAKQIIPYEETKKRLTSVGAPVECGQIGITRKRLKETFLKAQKIRSRFTILDVGVRTGYLNQWIEELFGAGGVL